MAIFTVEVAEKRVYLVRYKVEADNVAEAREKAEAGLTEEEEELRMKDVVDRVAMTEPIRE